MWVAQCPSVGLLSQCNTGAQDSKEGFHEYLFEKLQSENNYNTRMRATEDVTSAIYIGPQLRT